MQRGLTSLALAAVFTLVNGGPASAAASAQPVAATPAASPAKADPPSAKLVDINSASRAELKTLPGIGDAEAQRIIAARPYPSKAKLLADKILPEASYFALKAHIVAVQKLPPQNKTDGKANGKTTTSKS